MTNRSRARAAVAVAVFVATGALAACDAPGPDARATLPAATLPAATTPAATLPAAALPAAVTFDVEVAQSRTDRVARVVTLEVRNTGAAGVTVDEARLTTPFVEGTSERGREIGADRMRRLLVPLGPTVCAREVGDDPQAVVELDVTDVDGRTGTVVVTPTDETDDLLRIRGEDCAAAAVAAGLRLDVADDLAVRVVDGVPVADVTLLVAPVPGGPHVRVVAVRATTLLRPLGAATGQWDVDVDSAAPPPDGRLVLPTVPARCDLHAISEDKRGTVLGVRAVVDGVEQPVFYVAASDALRGALHDFVLEACGLPTDTRGG